MKKTILILLGALALTGCVTRTSYDARVRLAPNLHHDIRVESLHNVRNGSGFLTVQANVVNEVNAPRKIDWKAVWLDGAGVEMDTLLSTWNSLELNPHESRGLKSTAPNPAVADYRLYIRSAVK